jgi:hypothetical protein
MYYGGRQENQGCKEQGMNYQLFPGLIKQLAARLITSDTEFISAAENWMDGQSSECF